MEVLRANGYLPHSMGKIVPVRLSPPEIKVYVGISKQNPKFFRDGIKSPPSQPEVKIRAMNIFLQGLYFKHILQLALIFDMAKNHISMSALMMDQEDFKNRPRYFMWMEERELFNLAPKAPITSEPGIKLFTAPVEELFSLACKYQPEFVDIFNTFLALPSTEEN